MEGEWEMISGSIDGVPLEPNLAKYGRRITRGDQLTVRFGPQVFVKTRFILDPSKSPGQIDYIAPSGGKPTQLGIYAFHAGALMVSMAPKGHPPPHRLHRDQSEPLDCDGLEAGPQRLNASQTSSSFIYCLSCHQAPKPARRGLKLKRR